VPPHEKGEIEIKPAHPPTAGETLALEFKDARGRLVDAYALPIGQLSRQTPELRLPASGPLRIVNENYLAGPGTRVVGKDFELAFDQASGGLRRALVFGQPVLLELPHLHFLPSGAPFLPLPEVSSWQLRSLDISPEAENVRVKIQGTYEHFEGYYDLLITREGSVTVHSSFKYSGEKIIAREIGLAWSAPLECDLLR
jgi:hypothetical protein